jgi:tetratricopeptide (TPR) repeat protein
VEELHMPVEQAAPSISVNLKGILIIVILAGLALIALFHLRKTEYLAALSVTRYPFKPLTPPLIVNKSDIISDLEAGRFEALDQCLESYQRRAEANVTEEANAHMAYETFDNGDPRFGSALVRWVMSLPKSYSAHLARALFLIHQGVAARGDKWASETTDQQFARMRSDFRESSKEAETALGLDPMLTDAYGVLIVDAQSDRGPRACEGVAQLGLKQVPASFVIRTALMHCFEPRWGGSYRLMDWVAQESRPLMHLNPRLRALNGFVDADRANLMSIQHNYVAAVQLYTRAIDEGGDHSLFYRGRGEAFGYLGRFDNAVDDLRRADQLWPQQPETLEYLAWASEQTGKREEALDEIDLALRLGGPDPSITQVRSQLLMRGGTGTRTKGAAGD